LFSPVIYQRHFGLYFQCNDRKRVRLPEQRPAAGMNGEFVMTGTRGSDPTHNLFLGGEDGGLCCAVPLDRPVPAFLDGLEWSFAATMPPEGVPPAGFDWSEAAISIRSHGFYLFCVTDITHSSRTQKCASDASTPDSRTDRAVGDQVEREAMTEKCVAA
jgi:hypothetical protein